MPNRKESSQLLQHLLLPLAEWGCIALQSLQVITNVVMFCGNDLCLVGPPEYWKIEEKKSQIGFDIDECLKKQIDNLESTSSLQPDSPSTARMYPWSRLASICLLVEEGRRKRRTHWICPWRALARCSALSGRVGAAEGARTRSWYRKRNWRITSSGGGPLVNYIIKITNSHRALSVVTGASL